MTGECAPFLERAVLADRLAELRGSSTAPRIVLANGCFDLLHVGHARYLADARSHGDLLVVAINDDDSIRRLKGEGRPLQPLVERAELIGRLRSVDYVTAFSEQTLERTLRELLPHVHAKGTDYTEANVPERDVDLELGIAIAICGDPKTRSSSGIMSRMRSGGPS